MTTPIVGNDAPDIDLYVSQFETYRVRLIYRVDGVAQSLEGYSARMSIAKRRGARAILTLTSAPGDGIVLEPEDDDGPVVGAIDIEISAVRTALLRRNCCYDLLLVDDAEADRLFEGAVVVSPGVTSLR